jgi:hypothetical protein
MNFKLDALFDATDKPYLDDNALGVITQYISSVPDRLKIYGLIRDNEVNIMQPIADALQQMPNQSDVLVERSVRNGLMVMRYMAMAMVLDDTNYLEERLEGWLPDIVKVYDTKVSGSAVLPYVAAATGPGAQPGPTGHGQAIFRQGPEPRPQQSIPCPGRRTLTRSSPKR